MIFLFCISFSFSYSQVGGENVYQFLNIPTSARQIALGGAVFTLTDDVNQPIWNPATINIDLDQQLSVNYTSYLAGINIGSASYIKVINRRFGAIHGSVKYINYGTLIGADEQGNSVGNFNASDIVVSIGYAKELYWKYLNVGANLKFINSTISNFSSVGVAMDIAILYKNEYEPFVFTLVARNIGTQLSSFNGLKENIPFSVAMGMSYKLEHVPLKWYVTIDNLQKWKLAVPNPSNGSVDLEGNEAFENISFLKNMFRHFVVGAELFPKKAVNLRIGYNFRRAAELKLQNTRTFAGFSFGFGLKMNRMKLNYAYSKIHTATNVSTFSLQIDLNKY